MGAKIRRADHDHTRLAARRSAEHDLVAVTDLLIAEFAGILPAGTVIRHVARAREQLLGSGVRTGLATAAEALARRRLSTLVPAHAARR